METITNPAEAKEQDSQKPSPPIAPKGWLKNIEETLTVIQTIVVIAIGILTLLLTFFHDNIAKYFNSPKPPIESSSIIIRANDSVITPKPKPLPEPVDHTTTPIPKLKLNPTPTPTPIPTPTPTATPNFNDQQNVGYTVLILSSNESKSWVDEELKPTLKKHFFTVYWQELPQTQCHLYYYSDDARQAADRVKQLINLNACLQQLIPELGGSFPQRKNEIQLHIN
ncbi:MAG: hypothetical protein V4714_00785 [Bacteroidota bacterium]